MSGSIPGVFIASDFRHRVLSGSGLAKEGREPQPKTIWWGDMLVLTRKVGESIKIGEDIEIVVTAIDENKAKIGIRSPRHIPVYRFELYQKIMMENREAARMKTDDLDKMLACLPEDRPVILDRETETELQPSGLGTFPGDKV